MRAPFLALAAVVGLTTALRGGHAFAADLKTYSPIIEQGELALEARGSVTADSDPAKRGAQDQRYSIEYAPTGYWQTALYGNLAKDPGGTLKYEATAWENIFQLFPTGSKWLEAGLYLEYARARDRMSPDELEAKILLEKDFGPLTVTVNPTFEKELGPHAINATEFKYAGQIKWRWLPVFEPAIEVYGDIGQIKSVDPGPDQRHQIGPVALGRIPLTERIALRYEAGYLFGLTSGGSPQGAVKWLAELEIRL